MKTRLALVACVLAALTLTGSLGAETVGTPTPALAAEAPAPVLEPVSACADTPDLSLPALLDSQLNLFGGGLFPPGPTPCGANTCPAGRFCCNAACGLCSSPGGACTDVYCPD